MPSKFGGVPLEETGSKFGGIPLESPESSPYQETPQSQPGFIRRTLNTAASDLNPMNLVGTARTLMHPSTAFAPLAPKTPEEQLPQDPFHKVQRFLGGGPNAPEMRAPQGDWSDVAGHVLAAGVSGGLAKGIDALPRTSRAGANFNKAMALAKDQPVDTSHFADPVVRAKKLNTVAGDPMAPVLRKTLDRVGPTTEPLRYEDARILASSAGRKAQQTAMGGTLTGEMGKRLGETAKGLDVATQEAANNAGPEAGKYHADAMSEYRNAQRLKEGAKKVAKVAIPAAIGYGLYGKLRTLGE